MSRASPTIGGAPRLHRVDQIHRTGAVMIRFVHKKQLYFSFRYNYKWSLSLTVEWNVMERWRLRMPCLFVASLSVLFCKERVYNVVRHTTHAMPFVIELAEVFPFSNLVENPRIRTPVMELSTRPIHPRVRPVENGGQRSSIPPGGKGESHVYVVGRSGGTLSDH